MKVAVFKRALRLEKATFKVNVGARRGMPRSISQQLFQRSARLARPTMRLSAPYMRQQPHGTDPRSHKHKCDGTKATNDVAQGRSLSHPCPSVLTRALEVARRGGMLNIESHVMANAHTCVAAYSSFVNGMSPHHEALAARCPLNTQTTALLLVAWGSSWRTRPWGPATRMGFGSQCCQRVTYRAKRWCNSDASSW